MCTLTHMQVTNAMNTDAHMLTFEPLADNDMDSLTDIRHI